jgi:exonuclease III
MNVCGQTGLDIAKQLQIENFLKSYKIDVLHCQEINISQDSFNSCDHINSAYNIVSNNAQNKYGTCSIVSNQYNVENLKTDTNGRVIAFNIENITFCNVYMHSGSDPVMRNGRENYAAEVLPQILINCQQYGCVGGDWNSIIDINDATKNAAHKQSKCLKRLVKNFSWVDSFKYLHPNTKQYSRYYDNSVHGEGASRLDRNYHFGGLSVLEAYYVGVAFSDHLPHIIKIKLPTPISKLFSPKSRPLFKSKPSVIQDQKFKERLKENFSLWSKVRQAGLSTLPWWELIVKPGIKRLLIERGQELNKESTGALNLLLIRQSYLVRKLQSGQLDRLGELKLVQSQIVTWHVKESEKIKLQSRGEEINEPEM